MITRVTLEGISKSYKLYASAGGIKKYIFSPLETLSHIKKSEHNVLNNVSFSIGAGESVGVIGPNGTGKSTLLSLIAGVIMPDKGKIKVNGRVIPLLSLGAGFHEDLTGRENIYLNALLLGISKNKISKVIDSIIDYAEIREYINEPVRVYSSGMTVRLGFAIATHVDAEIILIDEVLAVGDQKFQQKCIASIEKFRQQNRTIIFVSHSPALVQKICTRAIVFKDQKISFDGDVDTALSQLDE